MGPARIEGERLPTIQAERLHLRWLEPADAEDLYRIFSDPEVMKFWSTPPLTEPAQARELVDQIHRSFGEHSLYQWGVALHEGDRVIGTCTLAHLDPKNQRAELGFALARDEWGKGLMREALGALIAFAFGPLDLARLEADVDPRNAASLGLLEHLGFVREGMLRERWRVAGQIQDSVMLGLLRREWPGAPPEAAPRSRL